VSQGDTGERGSLQAPERRKIVKNHGTWKGDIEEAKGAQEVKEGYSERWSRSSIELYITTLQKYLRSRK
jgi:hypothetical protein